MVARWLSTRSTSLSAMECSTIAARPPSRTRIRVSASKGSTPSRSATAFRLSPSSRPVVVPATTMLSQPAAAATFSQVCGAGVSISARNRSRVERSASRASSAAVPPAWAHGGRQDDSEVEAAV